MSKGSNWQLRYVPYKDPEAAAAAKRRHYEANKTSWRERGKVQRQAVRAWIQQLKESNPCTDCGNFYPYYVMDYDHRGESEKILDLSRAQNFWTNRARIQQELDKCDLLCANCHRIRTFERQQNMGVV